MIPDDGACVPSGSNLTRAVRCRAILNSMNHWIAVDKLGCRW
jgi:hypothetical protein